MRGIYQYQPQGPDELPVQEGELLELTGGPSGGQNYADGWWEGEGMTYHGGELCSWRDATGLDSAGRKGIFPSNYVRAAYARRVDHALTLI